MVTNPLDPASLPIEEIERLGKIAKEVSELGPQMKAAQAVAESLSSWKAIQDSTLRMLRENPGLFSGFLPKAEIFAQLAFRPSAEILNRIAEQVSLLFGHPKALERMYAFPFRQSLTATLTQGAVHYIRQTTPELAKQQTSPAEGKARDPRPRKEEAKAGEKAVSPRTGERLLDTAARSLALLDAELREQTAIVRTPGEWEMLRRMKRESKGEEIERWLNTRAQEAIRACKQQLGIQRGRRPKPKTETECYKLALKVVALLPEFQRWMSVKNQLEEKYRRYRSKRNKVEAGLSECVRDSGKVEALMVFHKPLIATCQYVAATSKNSLSLATVQNYYSRYQRMFPPSPSALKTDVC